MFVGKKLTDIRLLHGYSRNELAQILEVSEQSVWQYENNYNGPKLEIANKLKNIFNVKTKYFYNEKEFKSNIEADLVAYRSKEINSTVTTKYEAVHLEFIEGLLNIFEKYIVYPENKLLSMREYSINYIIENNESLSRNELINHLAIFAREQLGLGKNNQKLLFSLEKNGAFVFEKSLGKNIDAYSTWSEKHNPIIMLGNFKKSAVRRNFDLAHELGHLLLHYKVNLSELNKQEYNQIENEAHTFASCLLLPEQEFLEDLGGIKKLSNPNEYVELKEKWSVSIAAMGHRAHSLNKMNYDQYRYFNASLNRLNYNRNEPLDKTIKIIKPGKVRSLLQFLFEKKLISLNQLTDYTYYNEELIAKILGLDVDFLNHYLENKQTYFDVSQISEKRNIK
ncbi:helix-turn-helix domain-containing protein [Peribacillus sp. JNUCC41]|uniref:spr1629 family repressor/antitoxin n=1 Tax=Peribacillus sp. JNUCC41 TaxID=2778370 RepID=UPI00177EBAA2|nr:XRE family transcriptional regulator [Brevibacillus sp. JNUCC-41]QOS92060.1 ImmA/IrrE family metallo-endopeptidase [Brevibacillus sp. JNUCC-41]